MAVDFREWGNILFDEEMLNNVFESEALRYIHEGEKFLLDGNIETIEFESYDGKTRGTYILELTNEKDKTTLLQFIELLKEKYVVAGVRYCSNYGICIDIEKR